MVEDRARPLGRLGVGDRGADDGVEHLSPKRSFSDASASREWTVRMSARLSRIPSSASSGLRLSRASSTTSIACSTPWSAKYWASAVISAWSAATRALTVSSPSEGGQSIMITLVAVSRLASAR